MTYEIISAQAKVSVGWLKSIGHQPTKVTSTRYLARLCHILEVPPGELLSLVMLEDDEAAMAEGGEIGDGQTPEEDDADGARGVDDRETDDGDTAASLPNTDPS